ncbi:accessory Sec system protein translocase subunit SecY2 [Fructilactobacillus ixorae]|uniref:Accessory Sec system protein translocase subunit SecY2 n=1 Tax=Fructilactobacillus ixorae TaxID=1750535 RepID=A0ABY5C780_9LACO|nr:accessory Sec system protein translocase subunit SecY2 [Fructilactobacillus ixorae]USS93205.1 accessory Sec system protein translocase subunit SecY2 [Fructilactobacillus ixorae]
MKIVLKKGCFTLGLLIIFELGSLVLLPGFAPRDYVGTIEQSSYINIVSGNFGSQITVPSLFALGMGPYMTALIIWQTLSAINEKSFQRLSQKTVGTLQKVITIFLAVVQAMATTLLFLRYHPHYLGFSSGAFYFMTLTVLVAGAMLIVWMADLNAKFGIGGTSIFIIPGIIKNLPSVLNSGRTTPLQFPVWGWLIVAVVILLFVIGAVFINNSELRIEIERININNRLTNSYIPIKVLVSGAMPFMFALSLFSIPSLLVAELQGNGGLKAGLATLFSFNTWQGVVLYGCIIVLLGYGFAFVNFQPHNIAKSLKKNGDYIMDVTPGVTTEAYLKTQLMRMAFLGNGYILLVATVPLIIGLFFNQVTNFSFLFGSILILITMLDSIFQEIRALVNKQQYQIF